MRLKSYVKDKIVHVQNVQEAFGQGPNLKVHSERQQAVVAAFEPTQIHHLVFHFLRKYLLQVLVEEGKSELDYAPVPVRSLLPELIVPDSVIVKVFIEHVINFFIFSLLELGKNALLFD